jgi:hypothetical protein
MKKLLLAVVLFISSLSAFSQIDTITALSGNPGGHNDNLGTWAIKINNNDYLLSRQVDSVKDRADSIVTAISDVIPLPSSAVGGAGDTTVVANDTIKFIKKYNYYGTYELVSASQAIYIDTTDAYTYGEIQTDFFTSTTDTMHFTSGLPIRFISTSDRFYDNAYKHNYFKINIVAGKFIDISLNGGKDTITYGPSEPPGSPDEMLNNTTFADGTSWTMGNGNAVITGGVLNFARSNTYASQLEADMITPLAVSSDYRLTFTLSAPDGAVNLRISDPNLGETYSNFTAYTSGTITIDFSTPSTFNYPSEKGIRISLQYTEACTIDNISLKER